MHMTTNRLPWPVWSDSVRSTVKFAPLAKRQAVRLFHKARRFERETRQRGRQDGALGRNGLAVLHALLFDFLNYASGRLDPSYAKIAEKACISVRSAARGLMRLKAAGVLSWVRRCREGRDDLGRFRLEQESNAYGVLPARQWRGFYEPPDPPPPHPSAWGAVPPLPDVLAQATADRRAGGSQQSMLAVLESDPGDPLGAVLARLGRAILGPNP
jgi:hypothetical protein